MSTPQPARPWSITINGSHVLADVGVAIQSKDGRWRVHTIDRLGDLNIGPYDTVEEAKAALEAIARKAGVG
jgi:hypothetical protein